MRKKLFNVLQNVYGVMMTASFFAGILPLVPYIIAVIIGGDTGVAIADFIVNQYYPWIIFVGSVSVVVGLIAMYIGKLEGLSIKKVSADAGANGAGK